MTLEQFQRLDQETQAVVLRKMREESAHIKEHGTQEEYEEHLARLLAISPFDGSTFEGNTFGILGGSPEPTSEAVDTALTEFDALWNKVLEDWADEKRHAAVLTYALATESLPELAGCYQSLENDPEKGPYVQKHIDAIVAAEAL